MMRMSCQQPNEAVEVAREVRRPRDHVDFTYSRAPLSLLQLVLLFHRRCRRRLPSWARSLQARLA